MMQAYLAWQLAISNSIIKWKYEIFSDISKIRELVATLKTHVKAQFCSL
jgi:hypothetical protein